MLIAKANLYHFTVIYERILAFGSCCSCGPVLHNISLLPCGPIERAVAPVRYSYCGPWILPHIVSKHLPTSWMGRTRALRLYRKVLCIGNATHYTMSLYCCSNLPVPVLCSRFPCWRGGKIWRDGPGLFCCLWIAGNRLRRRLRGRVFWCALRCVL